MGQQTIEAPLLSTPTNKKNFSGRAVCFLLAFIAITTFVGLVFGGDSSYWILGEEHKHYYARTGANDAGDVIESEHGVVAADDSRCSEIGASMLRQGGHAVDASVAATLCLGVVHQKSSGIGGGAFMIIRSSSNSKTQAFDMRETAPFAASQNMYDNNTEAKYIGPLSIGVPGELAGLHEAWLLHGRLPWKTLFQPAIKLAKDGFMVSPYLGAAIVDWGTKIRNDPGLRLVYAPNGKYLKAGDICFNPKLARTLEVIAEQGPQAFYNGTVGEKLVKDVRKAGGILTMEDLRNYKVEVMDAMQVDVMGYTIFGMPPPSTGTLGLSLVLNIFDSYGSSDAAKGDLGVHRLIEALKHMFVIRMNLGDPDFVNDTKYISRMLSPSFAKKIRMKILDNTTFPPEYYMSSWSQLRDHGTSHFCIVDADRNAVSLTTTVNYGFGAGILSQSTGIVLNNEMGDFSSPTEISVDKLPPAPPNFVQPNKRPLSSMTPIIVTKDNHLVGVVGASGGMDIIAAVTQVFINQFVLGMEPLASVQSPRIYVKLIPNVVLYENWTVFDGDHIELSDDRKTFLRGRGHTLRPTSGNAITQLVVQTINDPIGMGRKVGKGSNDKMFHGKLTAVSDPRKGGLPAAV